MLAACWLAQFALILHACCCYLQYILTVLQLVNEVRQQLQEGAGQAAAVEHVAKKRLARLVGGNVINY
jgi:hypothetical protein